MSSHKNITQILFYILLVLLLSSISCQKQEQTESHTHGLSGSTSSPRPCPVCAGDGRCVPLIQCPAHLRGRREVCHVEGVPGVCCTTGHHHAESYSHTKPCGPWLSRIGPPSFFPRCRKRRLREIDMQLQQHTEKENSAIYTKTLANPPAKRAESDLKKLRASTPLSKEETLSAHEDSQQRLSNWINLVSRLERTPALVTVNESSPSHAHHLSMRTVDDRIEELGRGGLLNMFAAQHLKARQSITEEQLALGITDHTDAPFCPPTPTCDRALRYRAVGGECNNLAKPSWGAVNTGFQRLLPPDYSDGIWSIRKSTTGSPLPSARSVSTSLLLDGSHPSHTHNLMFMQFGQFIAHDITAGVVYTIGNGSAISCCANDGQNMLPPKMQHPACAAITTTPDDPFYGQFQQRCLNFVRAMVIGNSDCTVGNAKQMNGATHFLDLSQLYGNTKEKLATMRVKDGLMKTFNDFGRSLPPQTDGSECITTKKGGACFDTGDNHGNQVISLTVLHTLWTREHNRIARELFKLNPTWNDDTIFMESRRIVQAEFQHIIYNEWLPLLLGSDLPAAFGLLPSSSYSTSYNPRVNPSLTSEFSTAAMRFGHSIVDGNLLVPKPNTNSVYEIVSLPEVMFQPSRLRLRPFLDRLLVGLATQPMQRVDPYITEALTRYMFHGGHPFGLDLASINIQRGRDHGVRAYNEYRRLIGLAPFVDFGQMIPNVAQRLSSVYASPEDVDLWVGGLLEQPVPGGIVGATLANILADQFSRLKSGDRYFYEHGPDVNPGAFSLSQLAEIKKVTLSRIICDNSDRMELNFYSPNAFLRSDLPGNAPVPCDSPHIPSLDLTRFKAS